MKDDFDEEDFKSADEPQKEVNPDFGSGDLSGVEALLLGESFVIFGYRCLTNSRTAISTFVKRTRHNQTTPPLTTKVHKSPQTR